MLGRDEIIRRARAIDYGDGIAAGMEITLRLFLGEPDSGGEPFAGPRTPESEKWAREALERLETAKKDPRR